MQKHSSTSRNRGCLRPAVALGMGLAAWGLLSLWYVFTPDPGTVERLYSRGVYRVLATLVTPVTSAVDFSVALVLAGLVLIGFPVLWAAHWGYRRRVLGWPHWRGIAWGIKWLFVGVPVLLLWFLVLWGAGYQRLPAEERLALDMAPITKTESTLLREQLLDLIRRDAPRSPEDRDVEGAIRAVSAAMEATVAEWDGRAIVLPVRVKTTPPGLLLLNGTSGICAPFTLEPHVDGALPSAAFVATAAHELGHIAGICSEAEANLVGYMAGLRADHPFARYAAALGMYIRLLPGGSRDEKKAALEALPEVARQDIKHARETAQRYRIQVVQQASWKMYNKYLQSQGIKEGVKNYDRGITLFVHLWRDGHANFHGIAAPPGQQETPPTLSDDLKELMLLDDAPEEEPEHL